ncbi:HNH endonuclease family protein [Streptomyces sp. NPDC005386]|uniref:HNH endonuclease family protein n=1 Tax=Streptomyces sp. NPDC005386 TaxID=3154562 RepID=UPI0033B28775
MITHLLGVVPALALSVLPLAGPEAATPSPVHAPAAAGPAAVGSTTAAAREVAPPAGTDVPLAVALSWVEVAPEGLRAGYSREQFKHWNKGLDLADGCDTRREVILSEAVDAPQVGPRCALSGGRWWSSYDRVWITSASSLDVDHMVPLAETWDSGAAAWTAARREAYANDQGTPNSLIAVSGSSNRSKADKDPAAWLPVPADQCAYAADWVADELRWQASPRAARLLPSPTSGSRNCPARFHRGRSGLSAARPDFPVMPAGWLRFGDG